MELLKSTAKEPIDRPYLVRFTQSQWDAMEKFVASEGERDAANLIRKAVASWIKAKPTAVEAELLPVTAAVIGSAICGPFDEALADTETSYNVNADLARELDLHTGDVFVRAHGDSMAGMGITDGSLVTLEILPPGRNPRNGEIALVQIERSNGDVESSLKRWTAKGGKVALLDGDDNEIAIPADVVKMTAIGVARSYIARI